MQRPRPQNEQQGQARRSAGEERTAHLDEEAHAKGGRANRERIEDRPERNEERPRDTTATDPICGMDVSPANPPGGRTDHQGTSYYFCSAGCKKIFDSDPTQYAAMA